MKKEPRSERVDKIETSDQMSDYLKKALTRPPKSKETSYLYRYTKIQYLVDMLNKGYMRLGSCDNMNDPFETAILQRHGLLRKMFYACFTKASESLAMYKLYGIDKDSVIIRISYSGLEKIMMTNASSMEYGKYSPVHSLMIIHNNDETNRFVDGKVYCSSVGYVNPETMTIHSGSKEVNQIKTPFLEQNLAGKIKYSCWEYEDELRLCAELSADLSEKECVAVKLPEDFDSMISATLCPGFDKDKNSGSLLELQLHSVRYSQSVYDPIYTDILEKKEAITKDVSYKKIDKRSYVRDGTLYLAN